MMAITPSDDVSMSYSSRQSPAKSHFRMTDRILYSDTMSHIQSHLDGFRLSVMLFILLDNKKKRKAQVFYNYISSAHLLFSVYLAMFCDNIKILKL